jgi:hypothetical protein
VTTSSLHNPVRPVCHLCPMVDVSPTRFGNWMPFPQSRSESRRLRVSVRQESSQGIGCLQRLTPPGTARSGHLRSKS